MRKLKYSLSLVCLVFVVGAQLQAHKLVKNEREPNYKFDYVLAYRMTLNFGREMDFESSLFVNTTTSLFEYKRRSDNTTSTPKKDFMDELVYEFDWVDSSYYFILTQANLRRVYQRENLPSSPKHLLVVEKYDHPGWKFTGRERSIGQFVCQEAKGFWRGRTYTVWFTPTIPISFGPWKLHGLPGAVILAEDDAGQVRIEARGIRQIDFRKDPLGTQGWTIWKREEYQQQLNEYMRGLAKRIGTRIGREFDVSIETKPLQAIELYD
jgi:GLPGLI family protein